jgi:hypothetical protein
VTEETDRKEVEYVSRPDTAKSPKDKKSKLGRQSAILTRIIDEEKTLVEFFNVTLKKRKEKKKKETETESGQTQVVFNPKLKTAIQEESLVSKTTRIASKAAPWAKTVGKFIPGIQTGLGLLGAGYSASQGDYKGAALSLGSAIPGPIGWGFTGADITRSILSPEEKKDNKPATGATPAPKPEPPKSAATSPPAPPTPSSSSATPTPTPKPEPERNKIPNVGQKYDPISGKPFGGTDSQAKGVTNPLVPPSDLTKPSDMGGYSDKQIVKSPSYSEPEKPPSVETKPQPQSQPVQQPKPQSRQPQMSKPSQPEPKSDWATQELQKYREGRSGVFGQGGYESGGPSKIKAKDHVLKAFMQSKK